MTLSDISLVTDLVWPSLASDTKITGIKDDSRLVMPGDLFVTNRVDERDISSYVAQALRLGAAAVITHQPYEDPRVLSVTDADVQRQALGRAANAVFGDPTRSMHLIGVTGTNGKTTTCWLVHQVLQNLGLSAGYLGTLGISHGKFGKTLNNTTPFPVELFGCLMEMVRVDVRYLAMEVSSHSLDQRRIEGAHFEMGVFTNLSQDHLDYHGTQVAYAASKKRLFTTYGFEQNRDFVSVLNVGDPVGHTWHKELPGRKVSFALHGENHREDADFVGHVVSMDWQSIQLSVSHQGESHAFHVPLGGWFNAENALGAISALLSFEPIRDTFSVKDLVEALSNARPVPGRFESVPNSKGIGVIVDYAHTPDGLTKLLEAVKPLARGRIIAIFGCGGDRDRTKRPKMARAVSSMADISIVTSDNPRTEDPAQIFNDIEPGLVSRADFLVIEDRREAIRKAISLAKAGDVVVIAGKGHETYQIIGKEKLPFDDREEAALALEAVAP